MDYINGLGQKIENVDSLSIEYPFFDFLSKIIPSGVDSDIFSINIDLYNEYYLELEEKYALTTNAKNSLLFDYAQKCKYFYDFQNIEIAQEIHLLSRVLKVETIYGDINDKSENLLIKFTGNGLLTFICAFDLFYSNYQYYYEDDGNTYITFNPNEVIENGALPTEYVTEINENGEYCFYFYRAGEGA